MRCDAGICPLSGGGFFAACFRAWLDESSRNEALYQQIEEIVAQSVEKKRKAKHKDLLGMALHALFARLSQIEKIDIYKITEKEMRAQEAESTKIVLKVIECLAPLGSGEQALIGIAEHRKEDISVDGVPDAFVPMAIGKQLLSLAIKGKMDAIRARLEKM